MQGRFGILVFVVTILAATGSQAQLRTDFKFGGARTDFPGTDFPGTDLPGTDVGPLGSKTDVGPTDVPPTDGAPTDAAPVAQTIDLFQVTSDALAATTVCTLSLQTDAQNVIVGAIYSCSDGDPLQAVYTVDDVRKGVVIVHESNRDVVTVSAPDVDTTEGGTVNVHYLTNGITSSYSDWTFTAVNTGASWEAYTTDAEGHAAFDRMFFAKKSLLGKTIGISSIKTSWQ